MADELATSLPLRGAATIAFAALLSALLIVLLRPLLVRYALARPNARSSHTIPTPQGGGIAVVAATIGAFYAASYFSPGAPLFTGSLLTTFAAAVLIAGVGAADDVRSIAVAPRLLLQALAVALVIYALPDELRAAPFLPWWAERVLLVIGGVWFGSHATSKPSLVLPTVMLIVAALLLIIGVLMISRFEGFCWDTWVRVGRWALLAYVIAAGMIEFAFIRNHTSGAPLAVVTGLLVVFALDVPFLIATTVARYEDAPVGA